MAVQTALASSRRKISSSLKRWKGALDEDVRPLFQKFVDATLPALRGPFLAQHSPRQVLSILEEAFAFAQRRDPAAVKLAVQPGTFKGVKVLSCMNDQPFIVDTIRLFLKSSGADYWGGFNLTYKGVRDAAGVLVDIDDATGDQESLVFLEADNGDMLSDTDASVVALREHLELARALVRDFRVMCRTVDRVVERLEVIGDRHPEQSELARETAGFLKWLLRENFVFMGMEAGESLGIQTLSGRYHNTSAGDWPEPHPPGTVRVRKSHQESPVHRAGRIDEILVEHGDIKLFIRGMFTYRAVTQPSRNVPILRGVLAQILADRQSQPGSYRYKGIANVFDSLPTEFLFTASQEAIGDMVDLVLEAEQQQEVGATVMMIGQQSAFCLVAMPKAQYNDELRQSVEKTIVGSLTATYSDHGLFVGRYDTVLLHYYLTGVTPLDEAEGAKLSDRIRSIATPWLARLWHELSEAHDEARADRLTDTYGRAFPDIWVQNNSAKRAVRDIEMLESLSGRRNVLADVFPDDAGNMTLRIYEARDVYLSRILPVLDNLGLVVKESYATRVNSRGGTLTMDTFKVAPPEGTAEAEFWERSDTLKHAIEAVFADECDNDVLNRLVMRAGLSWKEVDIIRSYTRYCRQLQIKLSGIRMQEILLVNPIMCRSLVELFKAQFDPDLEDRDARVVAAGQFVDDELRLLLAHDENLLFSWLANLIRATLRTNAYRTDRPFHYLSFKLSGEKLTALGPNRPMFEVFVHHKDVEGVHLRFGKVARGGIRWSDRDDYRTEVLSLATTQQVKNVVIVPTGAKGGFYLKNASRDPKTRRQEADRYYKTFIRGLLDVTDNSVGGEVVPPPRVVRRDPDDVYMVVAADKGTAHLSDSANSLSKEYGYWLQDAFASGGSIGFDHKKVGITARGAWVLVRRHFMEESVNPYEQEFTCVGVGDMGGDVFGNGLTETPHARLLAAFNHLHIFLDPNPDTEKAAAERKRLFETQGGWSAYDAQLISAGGGVFERRMKSLPLSPEAKAMLGIDKEEAEPEEVIRHILKMDVDLLWNGGIGTYVKASWESHADADDRSNNAVRVDATELGATIVGEGGNLGFTANARVEAGLHGVRLNTDFIDNSGGVDLSDHEVNLKILLNPLVADGTMTQDARDTLLMEITEQVAQSVLLNNDAHGRQLSRDQIRSREDIFQFGRSIAFVEREFGRDPASLNLPDHETLMQRAAQGQGLTRPELAVLSAWVKMHVFNALLAGTPKKLPGYDNALMNYFPERIRTGFPEAVRGHMLADEIVATVVTTSLIADAGAAFVPMMIETTGASVEDIAVAYLNAQDLARINVVRSTLEDLRSSVPLRSLNQAWVNADKGVREVARYWLSARGRIPTDAELTEMRDAVEQVFALTEHESLRTNEQLLSDFSQGNVPEQVSREILKAHYLNTALMVWAESKRVGEGYEEVVVRHIAIARGSGLQRVLDDLATRPASGRWDPIALKILHARFHQLLRFLVSRCPCPTPVGEVDALQDHLVNGALADVRDQVDELIAAEETPSVATLLVLEERVASAIARLRN